MLVVATADFEVYHGVVGELRDRGVVFTTIELGEPIPDETDIVLTAVDDEWEQEDVTVPMIEVEPDSPRMAIDQALELLRDDGGRTVVGVDPGERPGVAVLSGDQVVAAFQVPLTEVGAVVRREIEDAVDPLVRVGDGARLSGSRIVESLEDVPVELVDETGTTPHLGTGARGMGDVLAAVNIARRDGDRVGIVDVEPTAGEIQVVKNQSRERTGTETLPQELARRVAIGELTMGEALAEHTDADPDDDVDP